MKKEIQPKYYPNAKVTCACGNTWETGSTKPEIRTEVCSNCHPFFTGQQQRILDVEGQVDRFYRKLQARQEFIDQKKSREDARTSPARPIAELELTSRAVEALAKANITTVGEAIERLKGGEQALLDIEGFGRKSLIDMKKQLKSMGYELPEPIVEKSES